MTIGFSLFVITACGKEKSEKAKTELTAKDVQRQAQEALEVTQSYLEKKRDEYWMEVKEKLNDIDNRIEELEKEADKAATEAKSKYKEVIEVLRQKQNEAQNKLQELKSAGIDTWEDLKSGVNAVLKDLEKSYNEAISHVK